MFLRVAALAAMTTVIGVTAASAEDLVFMLDNQTSYTVSEFYASPTNVGNWEEDILGADVLDPASAVRITIADGRSQCDYDLRIVFEDGDVVEDNADLCETGSYTVSE